MKLLLIPQWIEKALEADNQTLSAVLDEEKLLATLSLEDVAFYAFANKQIEQLTQLPLGQTFQLFNVGYPTMTEGMNPPFNYLSEYTTNEVRNLIVDYVARERVQNGMRHVELLDSALQNGESQVDLGWIVRTLNDDTFALIPRNMMGDSPIGMVNYLLMLMNDRMPFNQLAQTPLFRYYVDKA